ncbi:MAG: hypothetical protein SV201_05845 [Pseudomonadota bacterium]|nr:hypothetical protein [Pseudomonadota bacterium]
MSQHSTPEDYQARQGPTYKVELPGLTEDDKKMYLTINHDSDGRIFEIFARFDVPKYYELVTVITRMASMALREGVAPEVVGQELRDIHSPRTSHFPPGTSEPIPSLTARIGQVLLDHINQQKERAA